MEAFPLHWPIGYRRSTKRISSKFKITMDKAQRFLRAEVTRMGGTKLIISSNIPIRQDGGMYADWMNRKIDDPGVAIYFKLKQQDVSMCCDQYEKIWENVYALGKAIEAMRGIDRWGVSEFMERAFTGFKELPSAGQSKPKRQWYEVLDVPPGSTYDHIKSAYREKAKLVHPDKGGTPKQFQELYDAYMQGMANEI